MRETGVFADRLSLVLGGSDEAVEGGVLQLSMDRRG